MLLENVAEHLGGRHHVVVPEDDRVGSLQPLGELLQGRSLRGEPCQGVLHHLVVDLVVPEGLPELHGGGGVDVLVPHRDGDGGLFHLLLQGADQFLLLVALHDLTSFLRVIRFGRSRSA